jgi:hypothetical protein
MMTKEPSRREAEEMLLAAERGRHSLAERLRLPAWHVALLALAEAILFLLPGIASRPGHELRGAALFLPIAFAVLTMLLLDAQLLGRRGVRLRSDRARAYPSVRRALLISGSVALVGAAITWIVALEISWIASLPIGILFAAISTWLRLGVTEATLDDIRAGRTRPR